MPGPVLDIPGTSPAMTTLVWPNPCSACRELKRGTDADFSFTVEQVGQHLEPAVDPLPFELGIGIGQAPDQPVALIADRRVVEHARHRGRHHMCSKERGAKDARPA